MCGQAARRDPGDTSVGVEFLRDTGSGTCDRVAALLGGEIAVCDTILLELLAGAQDERHFHDLRRLLARATILPMAPRHYEEAAALFRLCRREGETVPKLIDCLIGAVAIHANARVLHSDGDFAVLARHTGLKIAEGSKGNAAGN
ncbi:MAG: PIN domain nuclease [Rhodospirillales bacterium]|nr:PIN domain nuclease [Rhodospirillales bacterium]